MLSRLVVLAVIAFAVRADGAAAQVVAGALPGPALGVAGTPEEGETRLELTLTTPDEDEPAGRAIDSESGEPPVWPDQAIVVTASAETPGGAEHVFLGGAVPGEAATVELGFAGGPVLRLPTVAGEAYTGR